MTSLQDNCSLVEAQFRLYDQELRDMSYLLSDLQSPLTQRLSFLVLPSLSIQHSQVVQCRSNLVTKTRNIYDETFY